MSQTKPILNFELRETVGKQSRSLRREGVLPAVVYGNNKKTKNLSLNEKEFAKVYKEVGGTTIINLKNENSSVNALIHAVQKGGVKGNLLHVDFYEVNMTEKITAKIPLHFVGDSKAVREQNGSLITHKSEVEVECLPGDLPHELEISIDPLDDFEKSIHVSDIQVPNGVTILDDLEDSIATVEPPRSEEELAELEEPIEAAAVVPEEEEEEKTEGEEEKAAE